MSEKDFVMAWLLAFRAGTNVPWVDAGQIADAISQAKIIYKKLEESNETNG